MSNQKTEFEDRFSSWRTSHPRGWAVQTDTTGLVSFLHAEVGRVVEVQLETSANVSENLIASQERIAEGIDKVNFGIDKISGGLESLTAAFEWGFDELIWQIEEQREVLQQILEVLRKPLDTQAKELKARADEAYRNGWFDEALSDFLESEKRNPYDFSIHQSLGNIYLFEKKDPEKALEYYEKATKYAKPRSAYHSSIALLHIGLVRYLQGEFDSAYADTSQAIALTPLLYEAHYQHAQYCANLGKHDEALEHIKKAVDGDRYYAVKVWSDRDFDPIREQLKSFLARMRNEKQSEVDNKISEIQRLMREEESQEEELSNYFEQTKKTVERALELMRRNSLLDCIDAVAEANKGLKMHSQALGMFARARCERIEQKIHAKESKMADIRSRVSEDVEGWSRGTSPISWIFGAVFVVFLLGFILSGIALLAAHVLSGWGLTVFLDAYGQSLWTVVMWCGAISGSTLAVSLALRQRDKTKRNPELRSLEKEADELRNSLHRFRSKYAQYLTE